MRYLIIVFTLASCSVAPMNSDCTCNASAAAVGYDNTASHLTAKTAQSAFDEIVARPIEGKLAPRMMQNPKEVNNPGTLVVSVSADCADISHDLPVSGLCLGVEGATLRSSGLLYGPGVAGWYCRWSQPADSTTGKFHAESFCLQGAR